MTVISQYVCLFFSVFIVMCIGSVTAGVPFHPKIISLCRMGLQTALRGRKTRADKKARQRATERARRGGRLQGQLQPHENKGLYFNDSSSCAVYELCA